MIDQLLRTGTENRSKSGGVIRILDIVVSGTAVVLIDVDFALITGKTAVYGQNVIAELSLAFELVPRLGADQIELDLRHAVGRVHTLDHQLHGVGRTAFESREIVTDRHLGLIRLGGERYALGDSEQARRILVHELNGLSLSRFDTLQRYLYGRLRAYKLYIGSLRVDEIGLLSVGHRCKLVLVVVT